MRSLDILFTAASYLQINKFLEAFHVTQLGKTHADTTCSYSASWETLIFNTFGPYTILQPRSTLQLGWFWQLLNLCVYFVNKCQIQLYCQHSHAWVLQLFMRHTHFCDLQCTKRVWRITKSQEDTFCAICKWFSVYKCQYYWALESWKAIPQLEPRHKTGKPPLTANVLHFWISNVSAFQMSLLYSNYCCDFPSHSCK